MAELGSRQWTFREFRFAFNYFFSVLEELTVPYDIRVETKS